MEELLTCSGRHLASMIREGEVSSVDVVEAHIEHATKVNPVINAIVRSRFQAAREEAAKADARLARGLKRLPPFLGVPCTIKENFCVTGMPQASGLVSRRAHISDHDAPTVARIRKAGAIPLGVTNTPELCMWMETDNRLYGRSNNPYDHKRIVGGSSGGEGAIIGAGGSPFGLGADVGGSIRMPAFFNGIFGHKPSPGVVPNTDQVPLPVGKTGLYCTTGPLARRAEDLYPLLKLLAGPDGQDPMCTEKPHLKDPSKVDLSAIRVINVPDNGRISVSGDLRDAQDRAAQFLAAQTQVSNRRYRRMKKSFEIWAARMGDAGAPSFASQLGEGREIPVLRELSKWTIRRSPHTLPALALAGVEKLPMPKRYLKMGDELREQLLDDLADDGVMLFPSYSCPAPRHYVPMLKTFHWVYCGIINAMAFPSTQVPLGLNAQGLPLGVQVVTAPGNDHLSLAVAQMLEQQFGGWVPPWHSRAE